MGTGRLEVEVVAAAARVARGGLRKGRAARALAKRTSIAMATDTFVMMDGESRRQQEETFLGHEEGEKISRKKRVVRGVPHETAETIMM